VLSSVNTPAFADNGTPLDEVEDEELHGLGHLGRPLPPFLYLRERRLRHRALAQRLPQDVGGGHRVLNGEIDADAADRRHGMRRIANAQKARTPPALQPVDGDAQQTDIVEAPDLFSPFSLERQQPADIRAERCNSALAHLVSTALGDDIGALPVVAAIDAHEKPAWIEAPAALIGVGLFPGKPEPHHVDRRAEFLHFEPGGLAHVGSTTIGSHHQPCPDLDASFACLDAEPLQRLGLRLGVLDNRSPKGPGVRDDDPDLHPRQL
jgi:hypothetical protein